MIRIMRFVVGGVLISTCFSFSQENYWVPLGLQQEHVLSLAVNSSGHIFAGTWGRIYRSSDDGATWSLVYTVLPETFIQAFAVLPDGTVLAGTHYNGGLFKSTDNGTTWQVSTAGMQNVTVQAFAIVSLERVLAATFDGVYVSTDQGSSWTASNDGLTESVIWSLHRDPQFGIYAGNFWGRVFRSDDEGDSWGPVFFDSSNTIVSSLTSDGQGTLNAGTIGDGMFQSLDQGNTWLQISFPADSIVLAISIAIPGHRFIGTNSAGVYHSTDNGITWDPENTGLTTNHIYSFLLDTDQHLVAGTDSGVFRTRNVVTSFEPGDGEVPGEYTLEQNYPNPFNPSTTIRFSIPGSAEVSLKIFNLLGEEVVTLVSGNREAGTHTVQWDATGEPSGVYFYRLSAGEFVETRKLVLVR